MVWRAAFAVLVSSSGLMILAAWLTGSESNPALTGAFSRARIGSVDILFGLFVAVALISTARNGLPPTRDGVLFALSVLAYAAGRFAPVGASMRPFLIITLLIVGIGTIVVGAALAEQWNDPHGRPIVFGFSHAATVFLTSLGFLLFAAICFDDMRRPLLSALAAAPALVVFAASQVRFTFLAIAGALCVAFWVSISQARRRDIAAVIGVVIASVVIGLAIRPDTSAIFLRYIITPAAAATERPEHPVAGECGELDNSVTIRKTLLRQAVQALPSAGLFGHGLSSAAQASCFKTDPHNSVLQAVLEFGWIGGLLFVLTVATALLRLRSAATKDQEATFVLCCLVYVSMIDIAHGHLTSDGLLFLFTGYATRWSEA